jgi:hypothetical protein
VVHNDTRIDFEAQDTITNKTFKSVTYLKTRKPAHSTSPPLLPALNTSIPPDYRELAHLAAVLFIYFIILCVSELLKFFTNKD